MSGMCNVCRVIGDGRGQDWDGRGQDYQISEGRIMKFQSCVWGKEMKVAN